MELKTKIGNRITQSRKALGITIKELAARTKSLSAARISNWEQGTRSPGPLEAKILADQLNVSASYLLCLTDSPQGEFSITRGQNFQRIPVLLQRDAPRAKEIIEENNNKASEQLIVVDDFNKSKNSEHLFAVIIEDNSMQGDFNLGDVAIVDPGLLPKPGDFVLAYVSAKQQTVLRKYREAKDYLFQLLASNELWIPLNVKKPNEVSLIGVVVEHRRFL